MTPGFVERACCVDGEPGAGDPIGRRAVVGDAALLAGAGEARAALLAVRQQKKLSDIHKGKLELRNVLPQIKFKANGRRKRLTWGRRWGW